MCVMKKVILMCAIALGLAAALSSCKTEKSDQVFYRLYVSLGGENSSMLMKDSEAEKVYNDIQTKFSVVSEKYSPENQWSVNIKNGKYDSADREAKARYATALVEFKEAEEYANEAIKTLSSKGAFVITYKIVLDRVGGSESGKVLDSYEAKISYSYSAK